MCNNTRKVRKPQMTIELSSLGKIKCIHWMTKKINEAIL